MSERLADTLPLALLERIDRHAAASWPSLVSEETADGWLMRASGGEGGRRLNTSLTPCRELGAEEIELGLERSAAFAHAHGIRRRMQVSPLHVHGELVSVLGDRGWRLGPEVAVMSASAAEVRSSGPVATVEEFVVSRQADDAWIATRERCNPDADLESLRGTVFPALAGRGHFCRIADRAVGLAVASDGLVALFGLAVAPDARRQGLGKLLVRSMLDVVEAETVYLQVDIENAAGLALYASLGFTDAFRYLHCTAPSATG